MTKGIRSIKRGMAVLLSACMLFGMAPIQAGAEQTTSGNELRAENDHYQNGFCVNGKLENGVYVHNACILCYTVLQIWKLLKGDEVIAQEKNQADRSLSFTGYSNVYYGMLFYKRR